MNAIEDYIKKLNSLAIKFRTNDDLNAILEMPELLNAITSDQNILINSNPKAIGAILGLIYECQGRDDWLGLADYLEHDMIRALLNRGLL